MEREREKERGKEKRIEKEIVLGSLSYTGHLLSIVKIKRDIERERKDKQIILGRFRQKKHEKMGQKSREKCDLR